MEGILGCYKNVPLDLLQVATLVTIAQTVAEADPDTKGEFYGMLAGVLEERTPSER